jgi:Family of unknown function (DUF5719)
VRIPAVNRFSLFGLVVLALVALFAVAWLSKPVTLAAAQQTPPHPPAAAAVSTAARACAAPGIPGSHGSGVALIAAAHTGSTHAGGTQAGGASPGQGKATITRLGQAAGAAGTTGAPLASVSQPGTLTVSNVPAAPPANRITGKGATGKGATGHTTSGKSASLPAAQPGGVMIQASGSMAQGLEAEQTETGGAVTGACASPATDFWFAMPGQQFAGVIKLYLMNTDSQASSVNVDIVTDTGPLQTGTDTGIAVPPHGLVVQSLAGLIHGSRAVGLHVHTTAGRVVAAVSESKRTSQTGQWLPASQAPAKRLVIPAIPNSQGTRELYVADPGGNDAAVKLSVAASGGSYEPTGAGAIDIPAGSASLIALPSLTGIYGAAVLTASAPVIAAVVVPGGEPDGPGAMTAAAPALAEQGVVADAGQRGQTSTLVLSAPAGAAKVRMITGATGLTAGATSGTSTQVISIKAKHSVKVTAPKTSGGSRAYAILLTPLPGSGPVYAGRVLAKSSGTVLDLMPVTSALTTVPLPGIRGTLITAAP